MESKQIDRRQFLAALVAGGAGGMFAMGSGSTGPAGSSATVGPGTSPRIPKWISANNIGDSIMQDDGTAIKPLTDNTSDLGTSALEWKDLYGKGAFRWGGSLSNYVSGTEQLRITATELGLTNAGQIVAITSNGGLTARIMFGSSSSNTWEIDNPGSNQLRFLQPGTAYLRLLTTALAPGNNNVSDLGETATPRRWKNLYLIGATIDSGTSDLTLTPNSAVKPGSDNTKDLGTSSLRFRDLYSSRRVIIAGKNALVLDGQSMTQSSHTVSNADTDIATYSLGANSYTRVIVRVTGYVSFVTLSTNQSVNLKIKDGTTQVGNTMVVDGALSAAASIPFTLEAAFVETGAVTLHFTEGAAAADANTTVFINSIIVLAES